jgi:pimeloyl-ACP methyl ester carboxylesterase/GNAT superfamily N-acetyltransferase
MSTPQFIYLHGFGSSPEAQKAEFFRSRFNSWGVSLRVPDLNVPNFSQITLSAVIDRVVQEIRECAPSPVFIIGSSFGATAALNLGERLAPAHLDRIRKMILLAPSLDFLEGYRRRIGKDAFRRWKEVGHAPFHRHLDGTTAKVGYGLVEDLMKYDSYQPKIKIPILIIHGYEDATVPYEFSERFAQLNPNTTLEPVNADHRLLGHLDYIWSTCVQFLDLFEECSGSSNVIIQSYDLTSEDQRNSFLPFREKVLEILESAYGERYYGHDVHLRRFYGESIALGACHAFLAFLEHDGSRDLVGCSYLRRDGKRCATGVLTEYRRVGIGRRLVCESFKYFSRQIAEIDSSDTRMKHLLQTCGFACVGSKEELFDGLGKLKALVTSIHNHNRHVSYTRALPHSHSAPRELVLMKYEKRRFEAPLGQA